MEAVACGDMSTVRGQEDSYYWPRLCSGWGGAMVTAEPGIPKHWVSP